MKLNSKRSKLWKFNR